MPAASMSKEGFARGIKRDIEGLVSLVDARGPGATFASAALPGALDPILTVHHSYNDGNYRTHGFATDRYWYFIQCSTS